jgi:ribonuclease R
LSHQLGAEFEARISGVTRAGLFVSLTETGASGFIPAATLGGEYFRFKPNEHAMTGDRTGTTYRLGDAVTVRLAEAAPIAGALRFEMLSDGTERARARRGPYGRPGSRRESPKRSLGPRQ